MLSAKKLLEDRPGAGAGNLLRGQDLPRKQQSIKVKITGVREAPANFNSPVIVDIDPVCEGKIAFPLNKTNMRRCVELVGDDLDALKGSTMTLAKVMVNNPQTKALTFGLVVEAVTGAKGARGKLKSKPKTAKKKQ